ncbi:MAG: 3-keto-5-aminohexanoate cleavage protein [Halovenus sp.]
MTGTWLEAAINGPWGRERQPESPITIEECIEEGVACAEAGAAIVHVHAFDPEADEQDDDPDVYAEIIEGIQKQVDAIVYPTIPAPTFSGEEMSPADRFAHSDELGNRGLLEWVQNDPGSINMTQFDAVAQGDEGQVYKNSEPMIKKGLEIAARYNCSPAYAIFDPSFVRLGSALADRYPGINPPIYRFMFSDSFIFGYPPEPYALESYIQLLEEEAPDSFWMVEGLDSDSTQLVSEVVDRGGHLRVGLEDAPLGTSRTNVEWVELACEKIEEAGGKLATPEEVRTAISEKATE